MKTLCLLFATLAFATAPLVAAETKPDHTSTKECKKCCGKPDDCDSCCHDRGKGDECRKCCMKK
jgi:hypothetical protein